MSRTTYICHKCSILLFLFLIPSPSLSIPNLQNFQSLNVSYSLRQTKEVLSPSRSVHFLPPPILAPKHIGSLIFSATAGGGGAIKNYTSLTLSRLARDQSRVNSLLSLSNSKTQSQLQSPLISGVQIGTPEYLTRIGVGRPVKEFYFAIDTGSDVTWLQCRPCVNCYQQSDPIFNPAASATYRPLPCAARRCAELDASACSRSGTCIYEVTYGDGSTTTGDFATETISFNSSGSVADVAIGCGHNNKGLFMGSAGLMGLGGGPLSLPSQLNATSFSYCLVNRDSAASSTLEFNSPESNDSVFAPMISNPQMTTFYYVGLTGVSVGGRPVGIRSSRFAVDRNGGGGVIVDSGTTVTRFPAAVYRAVRDAFRNMSRNMPFAGRFSLMDTCYDLSGQSSVMVPTMSFQFAGGKTLPLQPYNYLTPVDNEGTFCFAFAGTAQSMSIIGNIQQQGTRVSFNRGENYIAFSPNKC